MPFAVFAQVCRLSRCLPHLTCIIISGAPIPEESFTSRELPWLWKEPSQSPLKILCAPLGQNVFHSHSARGYILIPRMTWFFFNYVFRMEKMWKDTVFWGSRSSLGMTWNEFSWWVMRAWKHILFSFSVQTGLHIDACLLQLIHAVCTPFSKTSERKHWLKGSIPGVLRISGRTVLVECIIVCVWLFLSNEFQHKWSTLRIPDVVVNQNFGTFELKCNPLKFNWVPALKPNTDKNVFVQRFTWLPQCAAFRAVWLSPKWTDTPYCKFYNNQTPGC